MLTPGELFPDKPLLPDGRPDIDAIFRDGKLIDRAARIAVRRALLEHKLLGNPVPGRRDGKLVLLQPDEIVVPDEVDLL